MSSKLQRTIKKQLRRLRRHKKGVFIASVVLICVAIVGYNQYMQHRRLAVDPATYTTLLNTIAKAESKGNYNAYFGNAANSTINFTNMTIAEVLQWQKTFVQEGSPSSAVGKYQFINTTLAGLVEQLNLDTNTHFNQATQDKLAIALLERRGAQNYINNELTHQEFAANLAKEWAGLPKVTGENPDKSYYDADGLNKARVDTNEVLTAIKKIKAA